MTTSATRYARLLADFRWLAACFPPFDGAGNIDPEMMVYPTRKGWAEHVTPHLARGGGAEDPTTRLGQAPARPESPSRDSLDCHHGAVSVFVGAPGRPASIGCLICGGRGEIEQDRGATDSLAVADGRREGVATTDGPTPPVDGEFSEDALTERIVAALWAVAPEAEWVEWVEWTTGPHSASGRPFRVLAYRNREQLRALIASVIRGGA